jgi:predicted HAD superfamily Cof-like phosphohydrolase
MSKESKTNEDYIEEFHKAFGVAIREKPTIPLLKLRRDLIAEEVKEFFDELDLIADKLKVGKRVSKKNYTDLLKEMCDIQIVISGTAVSIKQLRNFHKAFIRVNESNMSKLGKDGKPIYREDGKILKGPNYKKPNLKDLI